MIIRKATLHDADSIANHILLAMEGIVYQFIGEKDYAKAKHLMLYFAGRDHNQYSYQNCWVAEDGQKVIGVVNVYDGALLGELRKPVLDYIKSRFSRDLKPEDETGAGEYYIDTLGVSPGFQGKGVGSKMLAFLIEEYVVKHSQILGLLVDEENPDAKRLYQKLGFKPVGRKVLLGKKMEHLQLRNYL